MPGGEESRAFIQSRASSWIIRQELDRPIGQTLARSTGTIEEGRTVRITLVKEGYGGYFVRSAYPVP